MILKRRPTTQKLLTLALSLSLGFGFFANGAFAQNFSHEASIQTVSITAVEVDKPSGNIILKAGNGGFDPLLRVEHGWNGTFRIIIEARNATIDNAVKKNAAQLSDALSDAIPAISAVNFFQSQTPDGLVTKIVLDSDNLLQPQIRGNTGSEIIIALVGDRSAKTAAKPLAMQPGKTGPAKENNVLKQEKKSKENSMGVASVTPTPSPQAARSNQTPEGSVVKPNEENRKPPPKEEMPKLKLQPETRAAQPSGIPAKTKTATSRNSAANREKPVVVLPQTSSPAQGKPIAFDAPSSAPAPAKTGQSEKLAPLFDEPPETTRLALTPQTVTQPVNPALSATPPAPKAEESQPKKTAKSRKKDRASSARAGNQTEKTPAGGPAEANQDPLKPLPLAVPSPQTNETAPSPANARMQSTPAVVLPDDAAMPSDEDELDTPFRATESPIRLTAPPPGYELPLLKAPELTPAQVTPPRTSVLPPPPKNGSVFRELTPQQILTPDSASAPSNTPPQEPLPLPPARFESTSIQQPPAQFEEASNKQAPATKPGTVKSPAKPKRETVTFKADFTAPKTQSPMPKPLPIFSSDEMDRPLNLASVSQAEISPSAPASGPSETQAAKVTGKAPATGGKFSLYEAVQDPSTEAPVGQAWESLQRGDYGAAEKTLKNFLAQSPNHALARYLLAQIYQGGFGQAAARPEAAMTELEKLVAAQPDFQPAYLQLIPACIESQRYGQAEKLLKIATDKWPDSAALLTLQGMLHEAMNNIGLAQSAYKEALKTDPQDWMAHYRLGLLGIKTGNTELAKWELQQALQLSPNDPRILKALATLAEKENNFGIAGNYYQNAMQPEAMLDYARLLEARNEKDKALSIYGAVESIAENDPDILYNLGVIYSQRQQNKRAEAVLKRFLKLTENTDDSRVSRAKEMLGNTR